MNKPSIENIDQWLFESVEGNLTPQQEQLLEDFLVENPAYLEEQSLWAESILEPSDDEERYPREKSLLKRAIWERPIFYISTAAATLVGAAIWVFGSIGSHDVKSNTTVPSNPVGQQEVVIDKSSKVQKEVINLSENESQSEEISQKENSSELTAIEETKETLSAVNSNAGAKETTQTKLNVSIQEKRGTTVSSNSQPQTNAELILESPNASGEPKMEQSEVLSSEQVASERKEILTETNANTSSKEASSSEASVDQNPLVQDLLADRFEVDRLNRHPLTNVLNERAENEKAVALTVNKPNSPRITSNADQSFTSSMRSFVRKVERMMDNPLALYNSKDQYFHTPGMQTLAANFAAVGDKMGPRILAMTRAQYYGNTNQQYNSSLSFDTYVKSLRGGIGVQLDHTYYGNGQVNVGQVALMYSPKIGLSKNWVLEPAVRVKVGNMALNHGLLNKGDMLELNRGTVRTFELTPEQASSNDLWYKDVALGMMTNSKWFFAGVQVDNLGKHFNNIYSLAETGANARASLHFVANAGTDYVSRNKNISLSPYVIYQKMEKLSEIWGGAIFRYKKLTLGGAYSSTGAYAGSIGLKTNSFMLTYNADVTTSALLDKQGLSHQMILRILINNGSKGQRMLKL